MVAETQLRHSQRETQFVLEMQLLALSQLSETPSVELSSSSSSSEDKSDNPEPPRSGHVKRPTGDAESQASQDRAAAELAPAAKSPKGRKVRKAKLMNTSPLLDEFTIE
jgi:hypothetical protein